MNYDLPGGGAANLWSRALLKKPPVILIVVFERLVTTRADTNAKDRLRRRSQRWSTASDAESCCISVDRIAGRVFDHRGRGWGELLTAGLCCRRVSKSARESDATACYCQNQSEADWLGDAQLPRCQFYSTRAFFSRTQTDLAFMDAIRCLSLEKAMVTSTFDLDLGVAPERHQFWRRDAVACRFPGLVCPE